MKKYQLQNIFYINNMNQPPSCNRKKNRGETKKQRKKRKRKKKKKTKCG